MASYVDYANSEKQKQIAELMDDGLSGTAIAEKINADGGNTRQIVSKIRKRAEKKGYSPDYGINRPVSNNSLLGLSGLSDMRKNEDGLPVWYKFSKDLETAVNIAEAVKDSFAHQIIPIEKITKPKGSFNKDIIPFLQIGDAHIGMLALESQVGHDFNVEMATGELKLAVTNLIWRAEPSERFVIHDVGDGTHFENESATTEHSGHALDAAAPYVDVFRAYVDFMTYTIEAALKRHNHVDVAISQGNHSRKNDRVVAVLLELLYANNPRVNILDNTTPFIPYRMGNVFVLCHHGDKVKPAGLASIMAQDWAQDWGETFYHYIDGGHVHHSQVRKEQNGAVYESFNQLAPSDRYAYEGGWRSRSFLNLLYRSKTYGDKGRVVITAEEVKDKIDKLAPGTTAQKRRKVHTV